MFKQSPILHLIVGVLWSTALVANVLERGFTVVCVPVGLAAVFFYAVGICLAFKRKKEDYHERLTGK